MNYKYQIVLSGLVFILTTVGFYNSLAFTQIQEFLFYKYNQKTTIIFSISFINALHFLFRPLGGIIWAKMQQKYQRPIFPILVVIYAIYNLLIISLIKYLQIKVAIWILIVNFALIGMFLGGIYPQIRIFTVILQSSSPFKKVMAGNLYFIAVFLGVAFGKLTILYQSSSWALKLIKLAPFLFLLLALFIYQDKKVQSDFKINNLQLKQQATLWECLHRYPGTILRFSCFLTFVTSLSAFFTTIMPFYLIHYLHYAEDIVLKVQTLIFSCSIVGLIIGALFHDKLGRRLHIILGLLIKIILYFLFRAYVANNLSLIIVYECVCLFFVGLMLSKIPAILTAIFKPIFCLNSINIIYNLAFGLFSGIAVFLSTYLVNQLGNLYIPSLIIIAFSYLSLVSLWFTPKQDFFAYK